MDKIETIEEFYQRKFDWIPDNIRNEIGHFNVLSMNQLTPEKQNHFRIKEEIFLK